MGRVKKLLLVLTFWAGAVVLGTNAGLSQCSKQGAVEDEFCVTTLNCGYLGVCATTICWNYNLCPDYNVQLECTFFGCTFASSCNWYCIGGS
jgi:hypothetical protein